MATINETLEDIIRQLRKNTSAIETIGANDSYKSYWVNVKDYGAVGDASTDNSDAIKNALDDAPEGAMLYFPHGH